MTYNIQERLEIKNLRAHDFFFDAFFWKLAANMYCNKVLFEIKIQFLPFLPTFPLQGLLQGIILIILKKFKTSNELYACTERINNKRNLNCF